MSRESHDFRDRDSSEPQKAYLTGEFVIVAKFGGHALRHLACNLKVSKAVISISRFLAAVANSHRLSAKTHDFTSSSSRLVGHISEFQAHG